MRPEPKNPSPTSLDRRRFLLWAAAAPLAVGGSASAPAMAAPRARGGVEKSAGKWQPWLVPSAAALQPPPPPNRGQSIKEARGLLTLQQQRTDLVRSIVRFWDPQGGVPAWANIMLEKIRVTNTNPVLAARAMALMHAAIADATIAAWHAKYRYSRPSPSEVLNKLESISAAPAALPSYPSEHAAVAAAAATVLNHLFPQSPSGVAHGQSLSFNQMALEAARSRLYAGANYPTDLEAGGAIGEACGLAAVQRAQSDGSEAVWSGAAPLGPQFWVPTPPGFAQSPLLPLAGTWQPWVLSSGDQLRQSEPGAFADGAFTPGFLQQVQEVADIHAGLTDAQKQIALFWADGGGTVTPPGHWMQFAIGHGLNAGYSTPRAARALALLAVGMADSAISCWDCKYAFWLLRPVTAIRTIPNQPFSNPNFNSFIGTPPFPAYTSGHSTFSGCAAALLEYLHGSSARVPDAFGHGISFHRAADQAAVSRLYGGIHYRIDSDNGLTGGRAIGELMIQRAQSDGAPAP